MPLSKDHALPLQTGSHTAQNATCSCYPTRQVSESSYFPKNRICVPERDCANSSFNENTSFSKKKKKNLLGLSQGGTLLSGVCWEVRVRDREREREGTSELRLPHLYAECRVDSERMPTGELGSLGWACSPPSLPTPTSYPSPEPRPGCQLPTASPAGSNLTLSTLTSAPMQTQRGDLSALPNSGKQPRTGLVPALTPRVGLLGQRYVRGDFFR